jgi:hypothetical protein
MSRNNQNSEAKKNRNRSERLALALRENLRRRKAQERARGQPPAIDAPKKRNPHDGQPR